MYAVFTTPDVVLVSLQQMPKYISKITKAPFLPVIWTKTTYRLDSMFKQQNNPKSFIMQRLYEMVFLGG